MDGIARCDALRDHFEAIGADEDRASAIYADDAVLEYPQGAERIRGKANITASRRAYPGRRTTFTVNECAGSGDLWIVDMTLLIGGVDPHRVVAVLEFRGGFVERERIYIAEPWDPPSYRAEWVERI